MKARVGLAVGAGTGPELAALFAQALSALGRCAGLETELDTDGRLYRTYYDAAKLSSTQAALAAAEDAHAYEAYLRAAAGRGVRSVFRTAFNAESIYLVRERLRSVKVERLPFKAGDLLLVRDQAQGFYAGRNDDPAASPDEISRVCVFSRAVTEQILTFALEEAARAWAGAPAARILLVYKYHLLDTRLARWVADFGLARGLKLELVQPDTMNRRILRRELTGRTLIVGSNEWLDIAHAELLDRHGGLVQDERCVRNFYLEKGFSGLIEYQTVHGSADDIAGLGRVNPAATLRAAAAIVDREIGSLAVSARLEAALAVGMKDGESSQSAAQRWLESACGAKA